jgi:hypothetical protein
MPDIPEGAQISEDGNYWWDGSTWQLVDQSQSSTQAQPGEAPEVTAEVLQPIGDTGAEPGNEELVTEQTQPYFEGLDAEDDLAEAELAEVLDDSQFVNASEEA